MALAFFYLKKRTIFMMLLVLLTSMSISSQNTTIKSNTFKITLDKQATIVDLGNPETGESYLLAKSNKTLLSVTFFNSDVIESPIAMTSNTNKKSQILTLTYPKGLKAEIKVEENDSHITFTLVSLNKENLVSAVYWGPFETTLSDTTATALGLVQGEDYSIGLLGLNLKSMAGYEHKGRVRFGNSVSEIKGEGSLLEAYSLDRTSDRIAYNGLLAVAIPGETVLNSSIALYGCSPEKELETIGKIEIAENLPHPMLDGKWVKELSRKYHTKFLTAFSERNIDECLEIAKKSNVHVIRMKGLYDSWGHYEVNKYFFPNGLKGLKKCVDKAKAADVILGSHLRMHLHDNDAYVSPEASEHLAISGKTSLAMSLSKETTEIVLEGDILEDYSIKMRKGQKRKDVARFVRVGTEIISYEDISTDKPYRLLNCKRGARKTTIKEHKKGESVGRLATTTRKHQFFPDVVLAKEMAKNLATLVNATGLQQIEVDGFDADDGHFHYTRKVFMETFMDLLDDKNILHGASDLLPYHWHSVGLISWGEPRETFKGSMLEYRIKVLKFLKKNNIPVGFGQYKLDMLKTIDEMAWVCARAAGYDAGWDLYLSVEGFNGHPLKEELLKTINNWQTAYIEDTYTSVQKEDLRDVTKDFKLHKTPLGKWSLIQSSTTNVINTKEDNRTEKAPSNK